MSKPLELPASETNFKINLLAVVVFFICVGLLREFYPTASALLKGLVGVISVVTPILLHDIFVRKVYLRKTAGLTVKNPPNMQRVAIKMIGLFATFGVIAFFYWIFPEYHGSFYKPYWQILSALLPIALLGSWYYFLEIDMRMEKPEDGYYHMGLFFTGRIKEANKTILAEHWRGWIVKAFFFPLMYVYLFGNINNLISYDANKMNSFIAFYDYMYMFLFTIDVVFAAVGYMMTFKFLDTHIRSVEPTMLGWLFAIMCYGPFWSAVFYGSYFAYNDDTYWGGMTGSMPMLQIFWGMTILSLIVVYSFATVSLGYRFSNLTYRGLVTNGPYRFTKHPAYVSKNLMWWMISVPFFPSVEWDVMIRQCFMLAGVNFIYYWRARTEENHLSNYPEYVEYAKWINENGLLRFVGDFIPYFKYSEERAKKSGSTPWWKRLEKQ